MILKKILSSEQVLQIIAKAATEEIPTYLHGSLKLAFDANNNIEIEFESSIDSKELVN